jgi:hypothetical protein
MLRKVRGMMKKARGAAAKASAAKGEMQHMGPGSGLAGKGSPFGAMRSAVKKAKGISRLARSGAGGKAVSAEASGGRAGGKLGAMRGAVKKARGRALGHKKGC